MNRTFWTDEQLEDTRRKLDPQNASAFTLDDVARMLGDPRQERRGELFDFVSALKQMLCDR